MAEEGEKLVCRKLLRNVYGKKTVSAIIEYVPISHNPDAQEN